MTTCSLVRFAFGLPRLKLCLIRILLALTISTCYLVGWRWQGRVDRERKEVEEVGRSVVSKEELHTVEADREVIVGVAWFEVGFARGQDARDGRAVLALL